MNDRTTTDVDNPGAARGPGGVPPVVYVIVLSQFLIPFMFSGVGITLPAMGADLQAGGVSLGLVESVYLGASAAFLVPLGRLADASDKNAIFKTGLFVFAWSTLVIGFMDDVAVIIALRFVQGVATAMLQSTGMAILADVVAPEKRGRAFGLSIGAVYAGLAAGPLIAGVITEKLGWSWVYFLSFAPLIASYGVTRFVLKGHWRAPDQPINLANSALIFLAVMTLILGSAILGEHPIGYAFIIAAVGLGVLFLYVDYRVATPLLNLSAVRANAELFRALSVQLCVYGGAFGLTFLFSVYLQTVKGYSAETAGQVLVVGAVLMACFAPLSGRLADRVSPRLLSGTGAAVILLSIVMAIWVRAGTGMPYILAIVVVHGLGFAIFSSPNMTIIMNSVEPRQTSIASALAAMTRTMGMVISMTVATVFLSLLIGGAPVAGHPDGFVAVMEGSFIVLAVLSVVAVMLSAARAATRSPL